MRKIKIQAWITPLKYFFFYLFLFSIPWQKRHIFSDFPLAGEFNEWTSISLYLSDILFGLVLFFWFMEILLSKAVNPLSSLNKKLHITHYTLHITILLLILWSALSLLPAQNFSIAFYRWLKLLEGIILFLFVIKNLRLKKYRILAYCSLIFTGIIQSVIAIGQYFTQHSLGLKILGEVYLAPDLIGVAKIVVAGEKIIRGYGTFPHPNVLGGFLILIILICSFLYGQLKFKQKIFDWIFKTGSLVSLALFVVVLFLTFSRTAWLGLGIAFGVLLFFIFKKSLLKIYPHHQCIGVGVYFPPVATILLATIFSLLFFYPEVASRRQLSDSSFGDFALSSRVFLNKVALLMIAENPWLGVGIGNFVLNIVPFAHLNLPAWRSQPVHNIYLAWGAEVGLPGLLIFLGILWLTLNYGLKNFKANNMEIVFLELTLISYLLIGFFDHYFYDLQQGSLIFWFVLALIWAIILSYKDQSDLSRTTECHRLKASVDE